MATQTVTAMFETRADAERAADALRSGLAVLPGAIHIVDRSVSSAATGTPGSATATHEDRGFFESIRALFLPDEDTGSYTEGVSRGDVLVSATVEHEQATKAMDILEQYGALDYDAREQTWRAAGWEGPATSSAAMTAPGAAAGTRSVAASTAARPATTGSATMGSASVPGTTDDVVSLYEERLNVGKRDVSHGRVRVRTYVTETPVTEMIRLRQEHVTLERRPVDRAAGANEDVFRDRVIEATETSEEAVVSKDVRVREEIALRKDVRTDEKTITDTVRRTEADIENDLGATSLRGAGATETSSVSGAASTRAL